MTQRTTLRGQPDVLDGLLITDCSSSMSLADMTNANGRSRLDAVRRAGKAYIRRLRDDSRKKGLRARCSVIWYDETAGIECAHSEDIAAIDAALDRMQAKKMTNITSGLEVARDSADRASSNYAILLSDGAHNSGPDPTALADEMKRTGFSFEVFAIFGNTPGYVNETLLKGIASVANGKLLYHCVTDFDQLRKMYEQSARRIVEEAARLRELS